MRARRMNGVSRRKVLGAKPNPAAAWTRANRRRADDTRRAHQTGTTRLRSGRVARAHKGFSARVATVHVRPAAVRALRIYTPPPPRFFRSFSHTPCPPRFTAAGGVWRSSAVSAAVALSTWAPLPPAFTRNILRDLGHRFSSCSQTIRTCI